MDYDRFSIYGFQIGYPRTWKVELNPKSEHAKGDVAFKSPEKTKMFVSWGLLETVKKKFASLDDQVEASIKRIKKDGQVGHLEVLDRKELEVCGHRALYTRLCATVQSASFFSRSAGGQRELWAMHLRCEESGRYFVVYASSETAKKLEEVADIYNHLQASFRCPCASGKEP